MYTEDTAIHVCPTDCPNCGSMDVRWRGRVRFTDAGDILRTLDAWACMLCEWTFSSKVQRDGVEA